MDVSSGLSLQLRFQTSKPQGLLFLAAGKIDYCLIELRSGLLQVFILIFKISKNPVTGEHKATEK